MLTLGIYDSPKKFTESLNSVTEVAESIQIIDSATGVLNEGAENQRTWGNLIGVDSELYKKFASIGQEKFCPSFKIKLRNYKGENLTSLIGQEVSFTDYEISFILDKFKQPIGLALVIELADINIT